EVLLRKAGNFSGVMALGGGALQDEKIIRQLKSIGLLIFLDAPFSVLLQRLKNDGSRPLLSNADYEKTENKIKKLLEQRRPLYSQSHITVQTGDRHPVEITNLILEKLQKS
ncbi:MAG: shikimate kinase, partial [Balneolaceae bacterium]